MWSKAIFDVRRRIYVRKYYILRCENFTSPSQNNLFEKKSFNMKWNTHGHNSLIVSLRSTIFTTFSFPSNEFHCRTFAGCLNKFHGIRIKIDHLKPSLSQGISFQLQSRFRCSLCVHMIVTLKTRKKRDLNNYKYGACIGHYWNVSNVLRFQFDDNEKETSEDNQILGKNVEKHLTMIVLYFPFFE